MGALFPEGSLDSEYHRAMSDDGLIAAYRKARRQHDILGMLLADHERERRGMPEIRRPRPVVVMLACNDHRNGSFAGRVDSIEVGSRDGDFHLSLEGPTLRVTVYHDGDVIRIGRERYRYRGAREWYGNFCWNAYGFGRKGAARLLNDLRRWGWSADEGFSEWFDKFRSDEPFTADDFSKGDDE